MVDRLIVLQRWAHPHCGGLGTCHLRWQKGLWGDSVKDLEMGDYAGLSGGPDRIPGAFIRGRQESQCPRCDGKGRGEMLSAEEGEAPSLGRWAACGSWKEPSDSLLGNTGTSVLGGLASRTIKLCCSKPPSLQQLFLQGRGMSTAVPPGDGSPPALLSTAYWGPGHQGA